MHSYQTNATNTMHIDYSSNVIYNKCIWTILNVMRTLFSYVYMARGHSSAAALKLLNSEHPVLPQQFLFRIILQRHPVSFD